MGDGRNLNAMCPDVDWEDVIAQDLLLPSLTLRVTCQIGSGAVYNPNVAKIVVAEVVRLRFFPNQLSPHGLSADFTNGEI